MDNVGIKNQNIKSYCSDLNDKYIRGELSPCIGRDDIVQRAIEILNTNVKNSLLLIGDHGVGKTSVVNGIVKVLMTGKVPISLLHVHVVKLDINLLVSYIRYRGEIENRLRELINEISSGPYILFVDDVYTLMSTNVDVTSSLMLLFLNKKAKFIITTTTDGYSRYFTNGNDSFLKFFQKLFIEQTTIADTVSILRDIHGKCEDFYKVKYSEDIIKLCTQLASQYIIDDKLPGGAITLMNEVGSYVQTKNFKPNVQIFTIIGKISSLKEQKLACVEAHDFLKAQSVKEKITALTGKLEQTEITAKNISSQNYFDILPADLYYVISRRTGIIPPHIYRQTPQLFENIRRNIKEVIIGQDVAIDTVITAIHSSYIGFKDPERPIGVFLFLGNTGVGKTELAQQLAKNLFTDKDAFIRVDMNEYVEKNSVAKLIGAPPGYVGYDDGGYLTGAIKKHPNSNLILLDEIEKAHDDVFKILLNIIDSGTIVSNLGEVISCRNSIIIMTSNLGINKTGMVEGFIPKGDESIFEHVQEGYLNFEEQHRIIDNLLQKRFTREFINRIDFVIPFKVISMDTTIKICDRALEALILMMETEDYHIVFTPKAKNFLYQRCYSTTYGVRHVKRIINQYVKNYITKKIAKVTIHPHSTIRFNDYKNEIPILEIIPPKKNATTPKGTGTTLNKKKLLS